jgi:ABC-2 type transport system permease protein
MNMLQKFRARYRYSLILLKQIVITDFKLRYQSSILGYLWSLLRPLFLFGVLYVIFVVVLGTGGDVPYFGTYLLLGLVLWNYFVEATTGSVTAIVTKGDLLRKINFPRYIIILANSISAMINLSLNFLVIGLFMVLAGAEPNKFVLFMPLLIFELFIFSLAISFFLSAAYVKYRDVGFIWEVIAQILFYATPILYAFSFVVEKGGENMAKILMLNPLAQIFQNIRFGLITDQTATPYSIFEGGWYWMLPFVFVAITVFIGFSYFRKESKYFAENV